LTRWLDVIDTCRSYFNTVGSKEGWTPSTFVSSRSSKKKDDGKPIQQRPEDFMDDEDLADAAEAQSLQTSESFSGLGSTGDDSKRNGFLMDVFRSEGDTMGVRLLRKMGWREGQGVGPRLRRKARLEDGGEISEVDSESYSFAPVNSPMITFTKKDDRKGLGYSGQTSLTRNPVLQTEKNETDEASKDPFNSRAVHSRKTGDQAKLSQSGMGVGILNDNGSEDEDPYSLGPRISYNKVIGGDKKKKKIVRKLQDVRAVQKAANPLLKDKPVFLSKKSLQPKSGFRKCHDGRFPLDGFLLSAVDYTSSVGTVQNDEYRRPQIPQGWKSSRLSIPETTEMASYQSTAHAAKLTKLDSKSRAAILGESQLPGKSVFDFLSPAARDRIAAATGKSNLPPALGEIAMPGAIAAENNKSSDDKSHDIPDLDRDVALAALGRGIGGWMPYAEDEAKRSRYRGFLELRGGLREHLPERPVSFTKDRWNQELREFAHAAQVFKPMTGIMASRFTSSSSLPTSSPGKETVDAPTLLSTPSSSSKLEDPAEIAAKMGMFGPMTRSIQQFYPTRLVCKRFNVQPPAHVQADGESNATDGPASKPPDPPPATVTDLISREAMAQIMEIPSDSPTSSMTTQYQYASTAQDAGKTSETHSSSKATENKAEIDTSRNDALEGEKAGEAVFKAIFGSDDDYGDND